MRIVPCNTKYGYHTSILYVYSDSDIHIQVSGLHTKINCTSKRKILWLSNTVHLSDWVEAVFIIDGHEAVTLVTIDRSSQVTIYTLCTLQQ